ncbi:hypothetical protein GC088_11485 [Arthrobacter sp. JZ12]|uniref:hypothetical protein n=1 Tax=Arthrobacter sp. JZ12 TaxID=2654190 RepID=UPI002B462B7D|nr:hypothetical protein [Arthrobacter sp. JZ12]WRH26520.1 hypothetical protein GC088_11485 [Arthrobacter sp. JZ12]
MLTAALAAAGALAAIVGASYVSPAAVVVVVAVLVVVAAIGWPHIMGVPARKSQTTAIALSALAASIAAYLSPAGAALTWLPIAVALGVGGIFLIQLIRGTGQSHRLESTLGASSGVLLIALGAGWVGADNLTVNAGQSGVALVTGISVLVAIAVAALPLPDRLAAPLGVALAALAGPLCALVFTDVQGAAAAVIGAVCGAVVMAGRRMVISRDEPLNTVATLAAGVSPVLGMGALVYFLERLLLS